jgi:hypothetical protein
MIVFKPYIPATIVSFLMGALWSGDLYDSLAYDEIQRANPGKAFFMGASPIANLRMNIAESIFGSTANVPVIKDVVYWVVCNYVRIEWASVEAQARQR